MDRLKKSENVQSALLIYIALFFAFGAFVWVQYYGASRNGPALFPLGPIQERFGDLIRFTAKFQYGRHPDMLDSEHLLGTLFPANYPPLGVVLYLFLLQVCAPYAVLVLLGVFYTAMLAACVMLWRRVQHSPACKPHITAAIFLTGLLGWGSLQVAMRGNLEGWMWIPTALGAWLFARKQYGAAGASFGVAMCIKPYPALWLLLMLRHRQWKGAVAGIVAWALTTLASLLMLNRNPIAAFHPIRGQNTFFTNYVVAMRPMAEMMGDHSLLQTMKTLARVVRNHGLQFPRSEFLMHPNDPLAWKLYHAYLVIGPIIALLVLWKVWNKPVLNQMFAVAIVSTLLPLLSGDYTLTILLIPMGFFLILLMEDVATGRISLSFAQMLWILLPGALVTATLPLGILHGVIKTAALLVLLASTSTIALPSSQFGETA